MSILASAKGHRVFIRHRRRPRRCRATAETKLTAKGFPGRKGTAAFTLGVSQRSHTIDYIKRQAEHHRKRSFEEEFVAFLKRHAIVYDPKYVWG
jgi:hypothetical protein